MQAADSVVERALPNPEATAAFGARIGARLAPGDAVWLIGPIGAGKTTLARGLISAWCGFEEDAPSPTYTLLQTYEGPRGVLTHADLYRLETADDAFELGLEDALIDGPLVVEWPERLEGFAPPHRLEITLRPIAAGRLAHIAAHGRCKDFAHDL